MIERGSITFGEITEREGWQASVRLSTTNLLSLDRGLFIEICILKLNLDVLSNRRMFDTFEGVGYRGIHWRVGVRPPLIFNWVNGRIAHWLGIRSDINYEGRWWYRIAMTRPALWLLRRRVPIKVWCYWRNPFVFA